MRKIINLHGQEVGLNTDFLKYLQELEIDFYVKPLGFDGSINVYIEENDFNLLSLCNKFELEYFNSGYYISRV
jgi:hypothetical protein